MLKVHTNVITSDLLEGLDIKNLGEAYIQTLTQAQDRLQTLNGYLVKQHADTFFAFDPTLASLVTNTTIEADQTISKTLQECYTGIIASLLLAGEPLRTTIRISACIHHPSHNHWTMLLAECTHNENAKKEYLELYTQYQADPSLKEGEHPLNAANNFLKNQKKLIFAGDREGTSSNWALPLTHAKIALTHYDSLPGLPGTSTTAYKEIATSSKAFCGKHQISLKPMRCAAQKGNTCADWSVYNAFVQGFQKKPALSPSSEALRFLFRYRSSANVDKILSYSKKTILETNSEKEQISAPLAPEDQQLSELSRTIPPVTQPTAHSSTPSLSTPEEHKEEYNDLYPAINFISKMFFTLLCAYITFLLIPTTIIPSFISLALGLAIGFFAYNGAASDFFGKKEIILIPSTNEKYFPSYDKEEKSGIFQELGFTFAPYHKELKTLEKEIADMIGNRSNKKDIVRYFIKHRIYPKAPECFYKDDISKINNAAYIPNEKRISDLLRPKN